MPMSTAERSALLSRWIQPSSEDEQVQQDRAERMVRTAIERSGAIDLSTVKIYTKGSYPNNTNVRRDSDVDVVVQQNACQYYGHRVDQPQHDVHHGPSYKGQWTPSAWRGAVVAALVDYFDSSSIDTTGKVAVNISAVQGSRPSADVVPSFDYVRYENPTHTSSVRGSCVFPADGGNKIVNWPQQQLDNGRALNTATGNRYKNYVRALKNAENVLAASGRIDDLPSYLMECLVFNVPAEQLTGGTLSDGFQLSLLWMFTQIDSGSAMEGWVEPNKLKWLFKGHQKWTIEGARDLIVATHSLLYGED